MITRFKLFEKEKTFDPPKYKVGDYVEIQQYKETDIMVILDIQTIDYRDNVDREDRRAYQYEGGLEHVGYEEDEITFVMEEYIIRKLTLEEVELHKNMNKYNL